MVVLHVRYIILLYLMEFSLHLGKQIVCTSILVINDFNFVIFFSTQGFSGMNRFNQSPWSKVQCEMILAFLSFAEYFRPRFFLLENVRNFVSFNKGQTFRLTVASLLEMGYQVIILLVIHT